MSRRRDQELDAIAAQRVAALYGPNAKDAALLRFL